MSIVLWDLTAPPGSEPMRFQRTDALVGPLDAAFDPTGHWLVTTYGVDAAFWPLDQDRGHVLAGHTNLVHSLAFSPDGRWLLSASEEGTVRAWPLSAEVGAGGRVLLQRDLFLPTLAVDPTSRRVVVTDGVGHLLIAPLSGGEPRSLDGLPERVSASVTVGDGGRLVAAAPFAGATVEHAAIRIWDIEEGTLSLLPALEGGTGTSGLRFLGEDRLLASVHDKGLVVYDLRNGTTRELGGPTGPFALDSDGRVVLALSTDPYQTPGRPHELVRFGLDGGPSTVLRSHGSRLSAVALDPTNTLVATGSVDGTVRVGPVNGDEPHVLLGHDAVVVTLAFSPDGRWLASAGIDGTIRLWPTPDSTRPPLHKLEYRDLLVTLRSRTNLRVVPDPQSATGWTVGREPFLGWNSPRAGLVNE